ncbi:MAG: N-acetylneuraminate synthase family protein [Acidobacteriota bacterium]|nr:N-acetylneuraminate synthase family protein [Acidobacteriota bacterium]
MQNWFDQFGNTENPCLVIGEIAQTHDGSLGTAHAYIDAIANAGAGAIKFQTHIAAAESTPGEPWRVKFSRQDETRYDYWRRMEFTETQWHELAQHTRERGLIFLSSAFSIEAVELLERVGVPAWKVGAGETSNLPLLEKMARTGKPVLLSSGMSDWNELDAAVACVRQHGAPVAVFQCTTSYPCPAEKLGLNVMAELRERYQCLVGLSDHSGVIYAGLAAATLGAKLIEVHVTFSRECFGPDVVASITTAELKQLTEGVHFIETALANPVNKVAMAESLSELKRVFGKSLVAARDLPAGKQLSGSDLAIKKPGTGIPAARYGEFINRTLRRAIKADTLFSEEDFE